MSLEEIWRECWVETDSNNSYYMDDLTIIDEMTMNEITTKFNRMKKLLLKKKHRVIDTFIVTKCYRNTPLSVYYLAVELRINWEKKFKLKLKCGSILYNKVLIFLKYFCERFNRSIISKKTELIKSVYLVGLKGIVTNKIHTWENGREKTYPLSMCCTNEHHEKHIRWGKGRKYHYGFVVKWKTPSGNIKYSHFCIHYCRPDVILNGHTTAS